MKPLYFYSNLQTQWVAKDFKQIPAGSLYNTITSTEEQVSEILKLNKDELDVKYWFLFKELRRKCIDILNQVYDLPDVNWSECSID